MRNTVIMARVRSLYDYKMDNLKLEQLNERTINLIGIDKILIIILIIIFIVGLKILGLCFKKLVDMSTKIQALEKLINTDHRDIQIETEEFKE